MNWYDEGAEVINYSNPRTHAVIPDWPNGRKRTTATFSIECDAKRGERAVRTTDGAPKKLSYAAKVRIVDGDDGKTYIMELTAYGHISIMRGDMKYQHETVFEDNPRYPELRAMFDELAGKETANG